MNNVYEKTLGLKKDILTPEDIKLFSKEFDSEKILVLATGLSTKDEGVSRINPDVAVIQIVSETVSTEHIIALSLCLRLGANPNLYVNAPKIGTVHILVYVYTNMPISKKTQSLREAVISILIKSGSNPLRSAFDPQGGKYIPGQNNLLSVTPSKTVLDWLTDQKLEGFVKKYYDDFDKIVPKDAKQSIGIYLENKELALPLDITNTLLVIRTHANSLVNMLPLNGKTVNGDYESLSLCVKYYNVPAAEIFLSRGENFSYKATNELLIKINKSKKNIIVTRALENILILAIEKGLLIDREQLALAKNTEGLSEKIVKAYQEPYWKKTCSAVTCAKTKRFLELAVSLDIDPSLEKESICQIIKEMSISDKNALILANVQKQKINIATEVGITSEFMNNQIPSLTCQNRSVLRGDPLNMNSYEYIPYRDINGKIWCFTSDMYEGLLLTKTNPYTSEPLSIGILEKIYFRKEYMDKLGISKINIIPFPEALESLEKPSVISDDESRRIIENFFAMSSIKSIDKTKITNLSVDKKNLLLNSIDRSTDLKEYTPELQFRTFVITSYGVIRMNPSKANSFFSDITMM